MRVDLCRSPGGLPETIPSMQTELDELCDCRGVLHLGQIACKPQSQRNHDHFGWTASGGGCKAAEAIRAKAEPQSAQRLVSKTQSFSALPPLVFVPTQTCTRLTALDSRMHSNCLQSPQRVITPLRFRVEKLAKKVEKAKNKMSPPTRLSYGIRGQEL